MAEWAAGPASRVALITGAAHGIGAGAAEALVARGWSLALVDLDLPAVEAVAARLGERATAFEADIADNDAVVAAVDAAVERFGRLDVCFANAGIATGGAMRHIDPEVFAINVEVNLNGTFRTVHACLPHLISSGGYLLLNASASALMAPPGIGAYGASKAGIENMGDTLRREVAHLGVDVGVLYLLWVDTDMVTGSERETTTFAELRSHLRGPLAKTMPLSAAVDAIVSGIEGRKRRAMAPGWLRAFYRARGLIGRPVERDLLELAPAVDAATVVDMEAGEGLQGGIRATTPAGRAAAKAVEARR